MTAQFLSGSGGKTLCEILTVADVMPLPMADPRSDGNLSRHNSVRQSLQRDGNCISVDSLPDVVHGAVYDKWVRRQAT